MSGGPGEYETLIQPIEDRMIRTVWRIVRDPDDADDALQEALEVIWKRLGRVRRHPNPHALILRICINCAYGVLRRTARYRKGAERECESVAAETPDPALSVAQRLALRETEAEILGAMGRLPGKQAEAVYMRFVEELPYGDIARALGCREATARKHIARARARLARDLAHLTPHSL